MSYVKATGPALPGDAELGQSVEVLRLLADRTRLALLALLDGRELSVGALCGELDRPAPAVSQHLAKLRAAGLVASRREGTSVFYTQPDEHVALLVANVVQYAEHVLDADPAHHRG
ncbi:ArsR/SmtB family transcription factor [Zafaria sp. Z1313]|uniref:ArsR/SmtB family transcription factor n=1 Tax=Zafaria sp. Z1313 TaxID=3423202 RepID=UPI003D3029C9